jgi:hypothetical protein
VDPEILQTLQAWVLTALVYPGLLFGVFLSLAGEWLLELLRPSITPRLYRPSGRSPRHSLLQPVYNFMKLAGRREPVDPVVPVRGAARSLAGIVTPVGAVAPVLALSLMPFPGSPLAREIGPPGDLLLILGLLAVQPVCRAILVAGAGGLAFLRGAQDLGRLIVGLFPILFALAALVEASGTRSLLVAGLLAAPDTEWQFLVRLLAGVALIVALPWWLQHRGEGSGDSAGAYAGYLLQRVALAGLWSLLVLPAPGQLPWALAVSIGGALFAYIAMHVVAERWAQGRRERDAAGLVWATALPVAFVALVAAIWSGV